MKPPADALDRDALITHLGPDVAHIDIEVCESCTSTNSLLLAAPWEASGRLRVLATENQTAGRGRRGRQWHSWPLSSLVFSVRWQRDAAGPPAAGLSLAAGVAVARVLERFGCRGLALKWPNDLLIEGGKAGGILVEVAHAGARQAVVIGVGLNLCLPETAAADDRRALFFAQEPMPSRNLLLARLLQSFADMRWQFDRQGFAAFADEWNARHAHAGREIVLSGEGGERIGRSLGADRDGALLLDTGRGVERILSGDVTLRVRS